MLPVVAIVGRPNVGKSTLFNTLTQTRDAIVADVPGVTRDRQYGYGRLGRVPYVCIDTGGLVENPSGMDALMRTQTEHAIAEADRLIFVADARAGLTPQDQFFARELRRSGKRVFLAVNKAEGLEAAIAAADFHSLGLGEPLPIAATHGYGCEDLMDLVLEGFAAPPAQDQEPDDGRIRIAVIGRPNVGKSTLINRLIGEERVITSDIAGTTRDSILVPFERDGRAFTLIDTAGVRRRAKVEDEIERLSVSKTLQAIAEAHVVVMVVDAQDSIGEQDASVLGLALNRGRALILAVNKWDNIPMEQREEIRRLLTLKLDFVPFAPLHFISARHGTGVGELTASMIRAYEAAMRQMKTPELTKCMEAAMMQHQPPIVRGRRIRLRYAHQGGRNPPRIVVHGSQAAHVPESYKRYLANVFRERFDLFATPVSVEFRSDVNPFVTDKPREKRGLKTSNKERRERRLKKDRAKRAPKKK
ncbi:MAG TPA: ribosome biogenesis GTPase Der [Steroidobacteraceae bacterium]|nr:ribosome biogenesis GTPase Der [Steroidobacteraceae bacterium]